MHIIYKRMSTYIDINKYNKLGKIQTFAPN